jgi:hypothetical protein
MRFANYTQAQEWQDENQALLVAKLHAVKLTILLSRRA